MKENPLLMVQGFGQDIRLDFLRRKRIHSFEMKELIEQGGLRGITSNPKIFDKVIAGSRDYDDHIRARSSREQAQEVRRREQALQPFRR